MPLSWAQIKDMPLTHRVCLFSSHPGSIFLKIWTFDLMHVVYFQVVLESLRMASIISFTFREAVVDVEYKGIFQGLFGHFT